MSSSRTPAILTGAALLMAGLVPATASAADGWTVATVTRADQIIEPRTSLALDPTAGSILVDSTGARHMAYLDEGALKVVSSTDAEWGTPVTAMPATSVGEVDDVHLVEQAGELTLVWLDEAPEGFTDKKRVAYTQTSGGVWTQRMTVFRSAIYVTKNLSIASSGSDVYVAYQRAGSPVAGNDEPLIYRIPPVTESATNPGEELPVIPDVTYINDGYLAASGPHHLAYAWMQEDGFASAPPWPLFIAFFDLRTRVWSTPEQIDDRVYELSMSGSSSASSTGATGMLIWEQTEGDRRIGSATLRGGDFDQPRGATPFDLAAADLLSVHWNFDADAALAACYCRSATLPSSQSWGVRGIEIPATGDVPAFTLVSQQTPTMVRRLDLAASAAGPLTGTVTWQDSDRRDPSVFAASFGAGGWSSVTDLGSGQWPMAVPSSGPDVLWWSMGEEYTLSNATTTHEPRPAPQPEPSTITVIIDGSRTAKRVITVTGSTTGVTDGAEAIPSVKKVKKGKRWQTLAGVDIAVDRAGAGSFEFDIAKANPRLTYRVYVTVDGEKSNQITIRKSR